MGTPLVPRENRATRARNIEGRINKASSVELARSMRPGKPTEMTSTVNVSAVVADSEGVTLVRGISLSEAAY